MIKGDRSKNRACRLEVYCLGLRFGFRAEGNPSYNLELENTWEGTWNMKWQSDSAVVIGCMARCGNQPTPGHSLVSGLRIGVRKGCGH